MSDHTHKYGFALPGTGCAACAAPASDEESNSVTTEDTDEPTYAVYVVVIEDTAEAFDSLCAVRGLSDWIMADAGLTEQAASELAEALGR